MNALLPYGLKDGKLIHIDDAEKGLSCGCICPACNTALIAKKGGRNIHHFAHYSGVNCSHGLETILHLKAKEILQCAKYLTFPPTVLYNLTIFQKRTLRIEKMCTEKRFGQVIPDAVLWVRNRKVAVELTVTHAPNSIKIGHLYRQNLPAIEINVWNIFREIMKGNEQWNEPLFRKAILFGVSGKAWIFNPKIYDLENRIKEVAVAKSVKAYENTKGNRYYHVKACPLQKRKWQSSFVVERSYANVFQDCIHCSFCFEIKYKYTFRGNSKVPTLPQSVLCFGHLAEVFKERTAHKLAALLQKTMEKNFQKRRTTC